MLAFLKSLAPTVITLVGGGYLLNRFFVGRANLAALVERICDAMGELRDDCASYWSVDYSTDPNKLAEQMVLEAKIKAQVLHVNALICLIADKRRDLPDVVRVLILDLLDSSTGGAFESKDRKADKRQFMKIVTTINKLSVELQRIKIWAPSEFSDIAKLLGFRDDASVERERWRRGE